MTTILFIHGCFCIEVVKYKQLQPMAQICGLLSLLQEQYLQLVKRIIPYLKLDTFCILLPCLFALK